MVRKVETAAAPARTRVGLPIAPDGSRRRPLLVALGDRATCNNGCDPCLTHAVASDALDVRGRHVVVRDREPTLRSDLPATIGELRARGPASISLLTNGRMLSYAKLAAALRRAGLDRVIVKLFGSDAASHDAHTRAEGSFAQALLGVERAREAGLEVHVAFPLGVGDAELARRLTGVDPVVMPEPEVEAHPNELRYDVVVLRERGTSPWWSRSYFPMVHVQTGPACNIRCTYCNVHGGDDPRLYAKQDVQALIDGAAEQVLAVHRGPGVPTVDFIGGEPTMHPELPALIAHARARGFEQVLICTNGLALARAGYLDRLVDAGLTGVRFSFHDHRASAAAELADVEGVGERYVRVAELLLSRPDVATYFYRILLASTIDALPDYLRFLAEHNRLGRPIELTFGMPSMRGRLFSNRHLYPPLEGLREKIQSAIKVARALGIEPLLHHCPACLFPEDPERAACLHIDTLQRSAADGSVASMDFEGDARYGRACERCPGKQTGCHGLPAAYWDADEEAAEAWLTPIAW